MMRIDKEDVAMDSVSFMKLVQENDGFELVIGFRDDVDYYIGGKGDKVWYLIAKGNKADYYVGTYDDGKWTDKHYKAKSHKVESSETVESGTTIRKVVEQAYYYQDKVKDKKPKEVEQAGEIYLHYTVGFGDKACQVSKKYGVTTFFSDISDEALGYHLRDITIGSEVEAPAES